MSKHNRMRRKRGGEKPLRRLQIRVVVTETYEERDGKWAMVNTNIHTGGLSEVDGARVAYRAGARMLEHLANKSREHATNTVDTDQASATFGGAGSVAAGPATGGGSTPEKSQLTPGEVGDAMARAKEQAFIDGINKGVNNERPDAGGDGGTASRAEDVRVQPVPEVPGGY